MSNKYNIDFYETMINANEYFDDIEDLLTGAKELLSDKPETWELFTSNIVKDDQFILYLEDQLNQYLEANDYQKVSDQLVINELVYILIRDAIPENDLGYVTDYLCSMSEDKLIEDVTRIIDKYNGGN
jgi:hypothetical protein